MTNDPVLKGVLMRTLVVGVGSPIRGDDGIGPAVAESLCRGREAVRDLLPFEGSGLDLLGVMVEPGGYGRVVLVDAMDSGQVDEGVVVRLDVEAGCGAEPTLCSSHQVGILNAFALARKLGVGLPPDVRYYAVGVRKIEGFSEGLSAALAGRLPGIVAEIEADLGGA